jgi:ankyrin repeat protein
MVARQTALMALVQAIAVADAVTASNMLVAAPDLATLAVERGATRQAATEFYLDDITHYLYAGDTALHIAAAGYRTEIARALIAAGADVTARNRRGAQPLHYAADGQPNAATWNPDAQAETIACLLRAGADPNATDRNGVTPLHRAVRTRCAAAVAALLDGGADSHRPNNHGSTPMTLAGQTTGRGGSGSPESKAQQRQIVQLLQSPGT